MEKMQTHTHTHARRYIQGWCFILPKYSPVLVMANVRTVTKIIRAPPTMWFLNRLTRNSGVRCLRLRFSLFFCFASATFPTTLDRCVSLDRARRDFGSMYNVLSKMCVCIGLFVWMTNTVMFARNWLTIFRLSLLYVWGKTFADMCVGPSWVCYSLWYWICRTQRNFGSVELPNGPHFSIPILIFQNVVDSNAAP